MKTITWVFIFFILFVPSVSQAFLYQEQIGQLSIKYTNADPATAIAIIQCESNGDPLAINENKSTTTGKVWSTDIGLAQWNDYYWGRRLKQLGFNIYDPHDNIEALMFVLDRSGTAPWYASKSCWKSKLEYGKYNALQLGFSR